MMWATGDRRRLPLARLLAGAVLLVLLGGCTTCNHKPWGRDVCLIPSGERLGWAAKRAVLDPYTLIPAAGAAIFMVTEDWDDEVSDWAIENKPVFGTKENANNSGDTIRDATIIAALGTALATPSGPAPGWAVNKGKGLAVEAVAALVPQAISLQIKERTQRRRPNGKDNLSFPSTRSAETAAWAAVGRRNVQALPIGKTPRGLMEGGFATLTLFSGWSRIENGSHYPSDVLAGFALGNFTALFIHDAFLGPSWRDFTCGLAPCREGMMFNAAFTF